MSLLKCPECQHDVSDKAAACPHCGYPMQTDSKTRKPQNKKATIPQLYNIYADDAITTSSFLSIAKYADLHVTESSSCIYEADYIGLNTILTGNSWEFHFKDLVEAGRVYTAQSADDFYAIFEEAISFCHYPRLIDNYSNEFDQFMKTLIQKKN